MIFLIGLFLMFFIGLLLVPIKAVSLTKDKKKRSLIILGIVFIILPLLIFIPIYFSSHSADTAYVNTGKKVPWQKDKNGKIFFIFNERKYIPLSLDQNELLIGKNVILDKPVVNTYIEYNNILLNFSSRFLAVLFDNREDEVIYTVKNCPDGFTLATGNGSIYWDEGVFDQKKEYYANLYNYIFYYTKEAFEYFELIKEKRLLSVETDKIQKLINIYGERSVIPNENINYMAIEAISTDQIITKHIGIYLKKDDDYYLWKSENTNEVQAIKLSGEMSEFIKNLFNNIYQ
jgi:hypothetical protein